MFKRRVEVKQRDLSDCGPACIVSVGAFFNINLSLHQARMIAGTDRSGTSVLGMIQTLEKIGFSAKGVKADFETLNSAVFPIIALVNRNELQHFVVVYGKYRKRLKLMDPASGVMISYSKKNFIEEWTGVMILMTKKFDTSFGSAQSTTERIWKIVNEYKPKLFQAMVGAIFYSMLGLSTSIFIQKIVDDVIVEKNYQMLNLMGVVMVIICCVMILINWYRNLITVRIGQVIDIKMTTGYFNYILKLPQIFFDRMRTGEIISRIGDSLKIRAFISDTLIGFVVNLMIVTFSFSIMFIFYWKLALLTFLLFPIYLSLYFIMEKRHQKTERKLMADWAIAESHMISSIESVKTIKQFGIEDRESWTHEINMINLLESAYNSSINSLFSSSSTEGMSRIFTIIILWTGSIYVMDQMLTTGQLLSFYALMGYFNTPLQNLMGFNKQIQTAKVAAERLFELEQKMESSSESLLKEELNGTISFENLCFEYGPGKMIFKDFNLTLNESQFTSIVGPSGSGKSSLLNLIRKVYSPASGDVYIDSLKIESVPDNLIRDSIAYVPQYPQLIRGTVWENLIFGNDHTRPEELKRLVALLGLENFIKDLPSGLNTFVGEGGIELSGGQKQIVGLLRIALLDRNILLLDEPVSMLDPESQKVLVRLINYFRERKRTIILVTHQLGFTFDADRVIFLEKGKVMEDGVPEELISKSSRYASMWRNCIPNISK